MTLIRPQNHVEGLSVGEPLDLTGPQGPVGPTGPGVYVTVEAGAMGGVYTPEGFGAVGDDSTDDTAAVQAALDAATTNGGTVHLSAIYKITSTLNSGQNSHPFRITGSGMGHINHDSRGATLHWTGGAGSGPMLSLASSTYFELDHFHVQYSDATYDGDLIDIEGNTHAADCTNFHLHHLTSRASTAITARSIIRLWKAINGVIEECGFSGAANCVRFHDANYVVGVKVGPNCTFNNSTDAHLLLGSPDGENIVIENCRFEAGTDTTAIRGGTVAGGEAAGNAHYGLVIRENWFGDMGAALSWIKDVYGVSNNQATVLTGNRFASPNNVGGIHLDSCRGPWLMQGNTFEGGTVMSVASNAFWPVLIANEFNTSVAIFGGASSPASLWALGNKNVGSCTPLEDCIAKRLAFTDTAGALPTTSDTTEKFFIGAHNAETLLDPGAVAAIYSGGNKLFLSAPTDGDASREVQIVAGNTPEAVLRVGAPQKLGFFGGSPVAKPAALTAADASTVDGTYGAEEAAVIANLRTRVGELETKLKALGLLS